MRSGLKSEIPSDMKKDNILFGVIGLLVGLIAGFYFTNKLNSSTIRPQQVSTANQLNAPNQQQQLPSDHPALDPKNAGSKGAGPLPQVQEAIDAAKKQPNNLEVQLNAGDLYYQIQNFDEAVKFYMQANKIKPDADSVWLKIGNANFDGEKYEQAQTWYEKFLAKNPDDINVRTDLGLTFFLRQPPDIDRAIKEYQTSLTKSPNHELTLQNLAIALRDKGDTAAFQETVERIRQVNPKNPIVTGQAAAPATN